MRFPDWFGSVHFLFSSPRSRGLKHSRVGKRDRQRDQSAFQKVEGLEPRKMLGPATVTYHVAMATGRHIVAVCEVAVMIFGFLHACPLSRSRVVDEYVVEKLERSVPTKEINLR